MSKESLAFHKTVLAHEGQTFLSLFPPSFKGTNESIPHWMVCAQPQTLRPPNPLGKDWDAGLERHLSEPTAVTLTSQHMPTQLQQESLLLEVEKEATNVPVKGS